jgi:hypothetical protein
VPLLKFCVRCFAFAFLCFISRSPAHATSLQTNASIAGTPQLSCGQSVDDALHAARAALAANDAANERAALSCALAALAAQQAEIEALREAQQAPKMQFRGCIDDATRAQVPCPDDPTLVPNADPDR